MPIGLRPCGGRIEVRRAVHLVAAAEHRTGAVQAQRELRNDAVSDADLDGASRLSDVGELRLVGADLTESLRVARADRELERVGDGRERVGLRRAQASIFLLCAGGAGERNGPESWLREQPSIWLS